MTIGVIGVVAKSVAILACEPASNLASSREASKVYLGLGSYPLYMSPVIAMNRTKNSKEVRRKNDSRQFKIGYLVEADANFRDRTR